MSSINFSIRMDESLKNRAFPIIESYGLTPAQAIKLFLNQIACTNSIPISFDHQRHMPNAATQNSLIEAREEFSHAQKYYDLAEMMESIAGSNHD